MSTKIHLFTGGKGGTGKTLIALCLATYFLHKGEKPLIVDLNVLNPDLSSIIRKLGTKKAKQEDRFDVTPLEGKGLLVSPSPHELDHYQLPNGVVGFYRDYLNRVFALPSVQNHNPDMCLIDTGYHIANLAIPSNHTVRDIWMNERDGTPIQNHLEDKQLNIWFLWTLQTLEREYERLAIKEAVRRLREMRVGKFEPRNNLHHVFNPYNIYPDSTLMRTFSRFIGVRDPLNAIVDQANMSPAPAMVFSDVMEKIGNAIAEEKNKGPLSPEKYADIVCRSVLKYARTGGKRPRDFYPVLRYKKLLNYTSELVGKETLSADELEGFLGKAYTLFELYMNNSRI